ncbi:hypothetical protein LARV_00258 [Longilinea arvoryzae]|uniref:ClbS/DfsB family four-helix bundle protein n=1 Tax=Longilinea arvoryzae TaxID=360412 RepID=A0A0S7BGE7_9CHLR|nr:ClbS/DfsB family four-helix bundle protein [Longilinea arvoryzae]GAP12522.1 hypothetical protein LARV_00258 [Longilinea arvoryzae]
MIDRRELLQNMQAGRSRLESAVAGLRDEQFLAPVLDGGWSIKDVLAHLAFWENRVGDIYLGLVIGELSNLEGENLSVDALNALVYERNRLTPLAQVRENESWAYQALKRFAAAASEEHLFSPTCFAWTRGHPFVEWIIGNTYEHYDEHLPVLLAWRKKQPG